MRSWFIDEIDDVMWRHRNENGDCWIFCRLLFFYILKLEQNGPYFRGDIFNCIFLNNVEHKLNRMSLNILPHDPVDNDSVSFEVAFTQHWLT